MPIPVIALTGYLGAGKTTLLNHLLRTPGARLGVVVNDFGEINLDAGFVTGQIDQAASLPGGCICCLEGGGGLDEALARLARPRLRLDAILLEASGVADPVALAHLVRSTAARGVRFGGLVDVVDAVEHFRTVDRYELPPMRYAAASLIVVAKLDRLPADEGRACLERIARRVGERNPRAQIIPARRGAIDPALLFDIAGEADAPDELPIRELMAQAARESAHAHHEHARAVTVTREVPVCADRVATLLESPPPGAYRIKGEVTVRSPGGIRRFIVHLAGSGVHVASRTPRGDDEGQHASTLVAIGMGMDAGTARAALERALAPAEETRDPAAGVRRLDRLRRLSA